MSDTARPGDWGRIDKQHCWHPFTQMRDWCAPDHKPPVLVSGEGAILRDAAGREFIDGNSSIWTNLHGHNHPHINAAIREQLDRVAHTSFLGFTHPGAAALAARLAAFFDGTGLARVFFSDDGSTAVEVAIKMAVQTRQMNGEGHRSRFAAFRHAYHGDTLGASSVGGVPLFRARFGEFQFPVEQVGGLAELETLPDPGSLTAVILEPLVQGVAGMRPWPDGMLRGVRQWCDRHGVFLILDEILTGFGRTGTMFACEQEGVVPDFLCLAKGLTGGYLPLAATLVQERIFAGFLGSIEEQKTFYYGHSYTANPLGCAAALASLDVFAAEETLARLQEKIGWMRELLAALHPHRHIGGIRQTGFLAGIPIYADAVEGREFDWREQRGAQICLAAREHGLLTRPIRDVIVLIPPYCITREQLTRAVDAIRKAVDAVTGAGGR